MRSAAGLLVAVCLAGCYTDPRGERNLCIPGADGLCPAPEFYHRFVPIEIVEPDAPVVLVHSVDDLSSTFEEKASDSGSRDVAVPQINSESPLIACGITCVAVWRDAEDWTVLSSVRSSSGWSTPERHAPAVSLPAVMSVGNLMLIAWLERESSVSGRVELRRLDPSGAVIAGATLASGVVPHFLSLTGGVDGALVTWKRSQDTGGALAETLLVAQLLAGDGTPAGAPFEVRLADGPGTYQTSPSPSAFVEGAYRVVDDQLPADSTWAVIDPVSRTIDLVTVNTRDWRDAIVKILAVADGALVVLRNAGSAGAIARVANDAIVSAVEFPDGAPVIAATADGYQLARVDQDFSLVVERRDSELQLVEGPTLIAESYQLDTTTCAVGRHRDVGIVALICSIAWRRRRRVR